VVFQNKNVMCQYRAVGHPIATAVTEGLVELAAARIGCRPAGESGGAISSRTTAIRARGRRIKFEQLSHQ